MSFNVRKAAQVIAFLARERGGSINYITVVKLAYLADRRFLELYDLPILKRRTCVDGAWSRRLGNL